MPRRRPAGALFASVLERLGLGLIAPPPAPCTIDEAIDRITGTDHRPIPPLHSPYYREHGRVLVDAQFERALDRQASGELSPFSSDLQASTPACPFGAGGHHADTLRTEACAEQRSWYPGLVAVFSQATSERAGSVVLFCSLIKAYLIAASSMMSAGDTPNFKAPRRRWWIGVWPNSPRRHQQGAAIRVPAGGA